MEPLATSVDQACRNLGDISRATLYRRVREGKLELVKIGSRSAITLKSQRALIAAQ